DVTEILTYVRDLQSEANGDDIEELPMKHENDPATGRNPE
ncbi:hypothetical protein AVEN_133019-2-1, partial [Araneus ventricosus]